MFDLFKKDPARARERFWKWFADHTGSFEPLLAGKGDVRDYHRLIAEMRKVDERVSPELTKGEDDVSVLVLSCDGKKEAMEAVVTMADSAPVLQGWRVERFRAPVNQPGMAIRIGELELTPDDVRVAYHVEPEKDLVHVALFVRGFQDDLTEYKQVAFLLLDHTIGEFNTMMHLGAIEFKESAQAPAGLHLLTLDELRQLIERECY